MNEKVENSTEMVVTPTAVEDVNILPIQYRTLSIEALADSVYSFQRGSQTIVGLDSSGVRYIAGLLQLSIESLEIEEKANELVAKCTAVDPNGRQYISFTSQNKKLPNGSADQFCYEKLSSRATRRSLIGLIPMNLINDAVSYGLDQKNAGTLGPLGSAKQSARTALKNAKKKLASLGLTPEEIYKEAEIQWGDPEDWSIAIWQDFTKAVRYMDRCDWIQNLIKQKGPY